MNISPYMILSSNPEKQILDVHQWILEHLLLAHKIIPLTVIALVTKNSEVRIIISGRKRRLLEEEGSY